MESTPLLAIAFMVSLEIVVVQVRVICFIMINLILKDMKIYLNSTHEFDVSDIDDCKDNPCNNGGTCQDGIASYECLCPPGFNGTDCEISIVQKYLI